MTTNIDNIKRIYQSPAIECIKLDNEISLALESTPPEGPGETGYNLQEHFNNDPFSGNKV